MVKNSKMPPLLRKRNKTDAISIKPYKGSPQLLIDTVAQNISANDRAKDFSGISIELTKNLSTAEKKKNGIFFTPPELIESILSRINDLIPRENFIHVLEPSCGSGEFITAVSKRYGQKANILGIEFHPKIFQVVKNLVSPNINIICHDFLQYETQSTFDLIIGNPPYFVVKKNTIDPKYFDYFDGRPDIFIIFLIKSLSLLKTGGILSFVLPNNFLNCLYYEKSRRYICQNFEIVDIFDSFTPQACHQTVGENQDAEKNLSSKSSHFLDTVQETVVLIVKKKKTDEQIPSDFYVRLNSKFLINNENKIIFGQEKKITELAILYTNSFSLKNLGFHVRVGNIVWNNHKSSLTYDPKNTLLIYSHNIKNGTLEIPQPEKLGRKKNYIKKRGLNQPVILVNRGYGTGKYSFSFCYVDGSTEYLVENHLLVIECTQHHFNHEQKRQAYNKVMQSFGLPQTKRFVDLYFCNNAINATELLNIFPIYGF